MSNQTKESAAKQMRNLKTAPKRWLKILDRKHMAAAPKSPSQKRAKDVPEQK